MLQRLQRDMNRLLDDYTPGHVFPAVNVWSNEELALVTAEVPGVAPERLNLTVENGVLTLKGIREETPESETVSYHRRERARGGIFPFHPHPVRCGPGPGKGRSQKRRR